MERCPVLAAIRSTVQIPTLELLRLEMCFLRYFVFGFRESRSRRGTSNPIGNCRYVANSGRYETGQLWLFHIVFNIHQSVRTVFSIIAKLHTHFRCVTVQLVSVSIGQIFVYNLSWAKKGACLTCILSSLNFNFVEHLHLINGKWLLNFKNTIPDVY
jgi:hypothetical protein